MKRVFQKEGGKTRQNWMVQTRDHGDLNPKYHDNDALLFGYDRLN